MLAPGSKTATGAAAEEPDGIAAVARTLMEGLVILAIITVCFALLALSIREGARAGLPPIGRSTGRRDQVAGLQDSDFDRIMDESRSRRR